MKDTKWRIWWCLITYGDKVWIGIFIGVLIYFKCIVSFNSNQITINMFTSKLNLKLSMRIVPNSSQTLCVESKNINGCVWLSINALITIQINSRNCSQKTSFTLPSFQAVIKFRTPTHKLNLWDLIIQIVYRIKVFELKLCRQKLWKNQEKKNYKFFFFFFRLLF